MSLTATTSTSQPSSTIARSLRHPKVQAMFKVQAVIIDSFREFMKSQDFFEFQAPAIVPATAEGGAEVFKGRLL
jgi:aspartyl/asparaginyl-tRNA synthetase